MGKIKVSGSLPAQKISIGKNIVTGYSNQHKGEKPVKDEKGSLEGAKTHVQTYANGDKEIYINY